MRNLVPYNKDSFLFHEESVKQKNEGVLKQRLTALNPLIEVEYVTFENEFKSNSLVNIVPNALLNKSSADLCTLYGYTKKTIRSLRKHIKDVNLNTISSTCQNCTVDTIGSMDHVLPQASYPEFIVHPKNLFPCCTTCNSIKNNAINDGDVQPFLNLYLDTLPEAQYLFAHITLNQENELDFEFALNNVDGNIEEELFTILNNHYSRLKLFSRMKEKALELLTAYINDIKNFSKEINIKRVIEIKMISVKENLIAYGYNHWFYILQLTLLQSPFFESYIQDLIDKSIPELL